MNCKFCNAEIQEDYKVCPYCGKSLEEEEAAGLEETVEVYDEVMEVVAEKPKKKVWPLVLAIVGAVVALGVLAVVLLMVLGVDLMPKPNDIHKKESYTVSDETAGKKADVVVATSNGKELTNTQLQIYYRMQVMDFLNYYGDYISYLGLDYNKPLSEQPCYYDKTLTWEQYFLKIALETWHNYESMASLAEQEGYTLGEEWQQSLDNLPADLEERAEEGKYESVDALLADVIGPGCTLDAYLAYVKTTYISNDYYNTQYEKLKPTDEEAKAYFDEHTEQFTQSGITVDSGLISSVRHILVSPEGGKTDEETGAVTYSEKEWKACLAKAEKIVEEWKSGAATEESFIALVPNYTEDSNSVPSGGLYEGIYKGSGMVEPFETWSIAADRKPGDVGIVKADENHYKGYHIIYFVSGEPHWLNTARSALLSERTTEIIDTAKEQWPMKVNYGKIALVDLELV